MSFDLKTSVHWNLDASDKPHIEALLQNARRRYPRVALGPHLSDVAVEITVAFQFEDDEDVDT